MDSNKEIAIYRLLINELLDKKLSNLVGIYEIDIRNEAILLTSEEKNYVDVLSLMEKSFADIQTVIQKEYDVSASFSGSMCDRLGNVHRCYQEARTAMGYETKMNNLSIFKDSLFYK